MSICSKCGAQVAEGVNVCPRCGAPMMAAPVNPQQDVEQNKVMAILAYFGILVLVPIFAAKESKFARFHANQGLILLIAAIVYSVLVQVLTSVLVQISLGLLGLFAIVLSLAWLVFAVLAIIGIINAAKGEFKELPIIGKYQILK